MEKESKPKIKTTKAVIIVVAAVLGVQALLFAAYLIISSLILENLGGRLEVFYSMDGWNPMMKPDSG